VPSTRVAAGERRRRAPAVVAAQFEIGAASLTAAVVSRSDARVGRSTHGIRHRPGETMNRLIAVAVAAAATLSLVACGDDDKSSSTVASAPVVDETVVDETVVDETVVDETVVDETVVDETVVDETVVDETVAGDGSEFCAFQAETNDLETPFDAAAPTPGDFEDFYTDVVPGISAQLQSLAPDELAADVAKVNEGIALIGEVLAANDWDVAALDSDPDMQALIVDPAFQTASDNIDNYCGF
jgi:hypothetical protein